MRSRLKRKHKKKTHGGGLRSGDIATDARKQEPVGAGSSSWLYIDLRRLPRRLGIKYFLNILICFVCSRTQRWMTEMEARKNTRQRNYRHTWAIYQMQWHHLNDSSKSSNSFYCNFPWFPERKARGGRKWVQVTSVTGEICFPLEVIWSLVCLKRAELVQVWHSTSKPVPAGPLLLKLRFSSRQIQLFNFK